MILLIKEFVLLIDRWSNQEALDIHHKSLMMKEFYKFIITKIVFKTFYNYTNGICCWNNKLK